MRFFQLILSHIKTFLAESFPQLLLDPNFTELVVECIGCHEEYPRDSPEINDKKVCIYCLEIMFPNVDADGKYMEPRKKVTEDEKNAIVHNYVREFHGHLPYFQPEKCCECYFNPDI